MLKHFANHYFIRVASGKFLIIEAAFIYMVFACSVLTYGTLEFYNEWLILPFLIPFLYGVYLFVFAPKIKDINVIGWRTQLLLLKDPKMIKFKDSKLEAKLDHKWEEEYGSDFEDIQFAKLQKWHPLALVVVCLAVFALWEWL